MCPSTERVNVLKLPDLLAVPDRPNPGAFEEESASRRSPIYQEPHEADRPDREAPPVSTTLGTTLKNEGMRMAYTV